MTVPASILMIIQNRPENNYHEIRAICAAFSYNKVILSGLSQANIHLNQPV